MAMGWCVCEGGERIPEPLISEPIRGHLCPEGKLRPIAPQHVPWSPFPAPSLATPLGRGQGRACSRPCPFAGRVAQLPPNPQPAKPPEAQPLPCCSAELGGGAPALMSHLLHSTAGASFPLQRPRGAGQGRGLAGAGDRAIGLGPGQAGSGTWLSGEAKPAWGSVAGRCSVVRGGG